MSRCPVPSSYFELAFFKETKTSFEQAAAIRALHEQLRRRTADVTFITVKTCTETAEAERQREEKMLIP